MEENEKLFIDGIKEMAQQQKLFDKNLNYLKDTLKNLESKFKEFAKPIEDDIIAMESLDNYQSEKLVEQRMLIIERQFNTIYQNILSEGIRELIEAGNKIRLSTELLKLGVFSILIGYNLEKRRNNK